MKNKEEKKRMKEFKYVIQDEQGIHARPAGILVKAAGEFKSDIRIHKNDSHGTLYQTWRYGHRHCGR